MWEVDIAVGQAEVKARNACIKYGEKQIRYIKEGPILLMSSDDEPRPKRVKVVKTRVMKARVRVEDA